MYKKLFLVSLILGIVVGLFVVHTAIEHNPQTAIYSPETGVYNIKYLVGLFISWCTLVCFGVLAFLFLIVWVVKFFKKRYL